MNYTPKSIDVEQGSPAWFEVREKRITASRMLSAIKMHKSYANELRDSLNGIMKDDFDNVAMQHGRKYEPIAAAAYEIINDVETIKTGFWFVEEIDFIGASPDPLVNDDGMLEIKCPYNEGIHLQTLLLDQVPDKHIPQIQTCLLCTGRAWCDFVSFDPRQKPGRDIFIKRVWRDDEYIDWMIKKAAKFMDWVKSAQDLSNKTANIENIPDLF